MLRVSCWQLQLKDRLTPLMKTEIHNLSDAYLDALKKPNITEQQNKNLQSLHNRLTEHWGRVYKDVFHRSLLIANMVEFEQFISAYLQGEYLAKPFNLSGFILDAALRVQQYRDGMGDDNDDDRMSYEDMVILPLEEMKLDVTYVEDKLLLAAATAAQHKKRPGTGIVDHILRCDWPKVAGDLWADAQLALGLYSGNPLASDCYNTATHNHVMKEMKALQDDYFTKLSSPTQFELTKRAMKQSPISPPPTPDLEVPSFLGGGIGRAKMSMMERAKSLFTSICGGIRVLTNGPPESSREGPGSSPNAPDDTSPLMKGEA